MVSAHDADRIRNQPQFHLVDGLLIKPINESTLYNEVITAVAKVTGNTEHLQSTTTTEPDHANPLKDIRVLLVEDHELNVEICKFMLADMGASVHVAENGLQAVQWLEANPQGVDVVLMDMQMPVLDGCSATTRIRQELGLNNLPIIALTAGALVAQKEAAYAAGMNDFLTKPFEAEKISKCILKHLKS